MISNDINVDSCLVRIPIEYVQVNKESGILDKWMDYNEATQELREKKNRTKRLIVPGVGYEFYYSLQSRPVNNVLQHFLYLTINAKMNKRKYFDGVTLDNIEVIYNEIIAQKVVFFELDKLLHYSICTDIDFKKDFIQNSEGYIDLLQNLKDITRSTKKQKGYKPYRLGIEWNTRQNATPAQPYVKIYDKSTELKKIKNKGFTEAFISDIDTTNLRRIEFQIKNKKHFDSLELYDRSLFGVLSLSQEQKRNALRRVLKKVVNISSPPKERAINTLKLTPIQQFMMNSLQSQLKIGIKVEDAINSLTKGMNSNNADKYRKKLNLIYSELVSTEKMPASVILTQNMMMFLQNQKRDFT